MSAATEPLMQDASVRELFGILRGSNIDARDLANIVGSITSIEMQLSDAMKDLTAMRRELATMRYENSHPIKLALEKAARSLSEKIRGIFAKLKAVKAGIINGCKRAIAAFRDRGVSALGGLTEFVHVKPALESLRDSINDGIRSSQASIARIEKVSAEYHAAGRALRNFGRAIRGQETIPEMKPNGTLARLAAAPFQFQQRKLTDSLRTVNQALAGLDRLEKAAARRAEQRGPSLQDRLNAAKVKVEQEKRDAPEQQRSRQSEVAI